MLILRILLLFVLLCSFVNVKTISVQGNERDDSKVLFLVSDFNGMSSAGRNFQKKHRNKAQLRTIGSLLFRPGVFLAPYSDAPLVAADPLQDPVVANNEANRIFLNALIMALQQPSGQDASTSVSASPSPVWEAQSDENLTRVQKDQNNMIDEKVTREFIIGFIKGVQTGSDNTMSDTATVNNRVA